MDDASISNLSAGTTREQQLATAHAVLFRVVKAIDPDAGSLTFQTVETPLYRDYLNRQAAYNSARLAYTEAYLEARKTTTGRNTWPMVANTLQLPVNTAYDQWRSGDADRIEQAIATIQALQE
jgi:hypothetical protein